MSYESPKSPLHKLKAREFSTADKYSNLELTSEKVEELMNENETLKACLANLGFTSEFQLHEIKKRREGKSNSMINRSVGQEMTEWELTERNEYLHKKIDRLQKEKEKQTESLNKIRNSEKWKNRNQCNILSCFRDKYMRLLRIRCPSTSY